jgi:hypothetical protein
LMNKKIKHGYEDGENTEGVLEEAISKRETSFLSKEK